MYSKERMGRRIYVGIDTSKDHLDVVPIDIYGQELLAPCRYAQNRDCFEQCLQNMKTIAKETKSELLFGIESTGIYHIPFHDFLDKRGYKVRIFNGLEVRGFKKTRIRKTETDKIAAKTIANALRFCFDPEKKSPLPNELRNLREFCRARGRLVEKQTQIENQLGRNLDLIFPGLTNLFGNKVSKQFLQLLDQACTPTEICEMDEKVLTALLPKQKVKHILQLAQTTQGAVLLDKAVSFEVKSHIRILRVIQEEIKQLNREIETEFKKNDSVILSINGIGLITGAIILTELGDINCFSSPKQIVGFAGLDSVIKESGRFRGEYKISKCGSKQLRTALYQAAFNGSRCNPVLKSYYVKMRSKGKTHRDAVVCCARKLCHIVYSVLKNNKPFFVPLPHERGPTQSAEPIKTDNEQSGPIHSTTPYSNQSLPVDSLDSQAASRRGGVWPEPAEQLGGFGETRKGRIDSICPERKNYRFEIERYLVVQR